MGISLPLREGESCIPLVDQKKAEQNGLPGILRSFRRFLYEQRLAGNEIRRNPKPQSRAQIMKRILLAAIMTGCLVSARAAIYEYTVSLDGPSEPTASLGTGLGSVFYDDIAHSLQLQVSWSGLTGGTTVSHIHGPTTTPFTGTAGVVLTPTTLPGFPAGVTSGSYSTTLDLTLASTYPAAYITANGGTTAGAEAAITAAIAQGRTYWNIHSSVFGGGEIRGFLVAVPEPSSLALVGLGLVGLATRAHRQRTAN